MGANLSALTLTPDSTNSLFASPPLPGFEDLLLSPALYPEFPLLNWTLVQNEPEDAVSSTDWVGRVPAIMPHATSIHQPIWSSSPDTFGGTGVRSTTMKVALGGMIALLMLALLGFGVSFFTMREQAVARKMMKEQYRRAQS